MQSYNLDDHISAFYRDSQRRKKPLIGITVNYTDGNASLSERYYKQVEAAGGVPLFIPPLTDHAVIADTLESIDGLLLTGGGDINPLWMGEEPSPLLHSVNNERDLPELMLARMAYYKNIPILGICRGVQTLAVALGGQVAQDLSLIEGIDKDNLLKHSQEGARDMTSHQVVLHQNTILHDIYQADTIYVNSFHHQAVKAVGSKLKVSATSPDGIIEAVESSEFKSVMGVQWHPEWLGEEGRKVFSWLVEQADIYHKAFVFHQQHITLDSHCDTPMFFSKDIHLEYRDEKILVDHSKMEDGRLDVATMVAYLPQPKAGESFADIVPFPVQTPREYADLLFDKIEKTVEQFPWKFALARNKADVIRNKKAGKRTIMLGIENALALDGDIRNVEHFAQRGIVYMTLCHNGDNDLCDSARGSATHGGVSEFGEQVIKEMNRLGVAVDLSHAAQSSFFDALEISQYPVVCSHSNCRSLCDHPRNLTDEQLLALAKKGGVVQITFYNGFLKEACEASVKDALAHLNHAVRLIGVDHVGIGSDFDGDGGVPGISDASDMMNFTMHLLRRRYSTDDLRKIWGENWLRVVGRD